MKKSKEELHVLQLNSSFIIVEVLISTEGDYACHDSLGPEDTITLPVYTVTHVPSGMAVKACMSNLYLANLLTLRCSRVPILWDGEGDMPEDFGKELKAVRDKLEREIDGGF